MRPAWPVHDDYLSESRNRCLVSACAGLQSTGSFAGIADKKLLVDIVAHIDLGDTLDLILRTIKQCRIVEFAEEIERNHGAVALLAAAAVFTVLPLRIFLLENTHAVHRMLLRFTRRRQRRFLGSPCPAAAPGPSVPSCPGLRALPVR